MITRFVLSILVFGSFTTYSQVNPNRRIEKPIQSSPFPPNANSLYPGGYKFFDKFDGSQYNKASDRFSTSEIGSGFNEMGEVYFFDPMPCVNPQGNFHMRIYSPDPSVDYKIMLKKYGDHQMPPE